MAHWSTTQKGKEFIEAAFKAANLPEVKETDLEPGTYTNQQIAEKVDNPEKLLALLMGLPGNDRASKRSILSFAIEMEEPEMISGERQ